MTNEAVAKSRKEAARAARTHRRVYVTGCGANLAGDAFAGLPENVVVVAEKSEETPEAVAGDVGAIGCVQADARLDRVRAFVKVQDGCSFSCRFCVIPLVRGASRSRAADAVLGEIRRRVAQGHREVVLTGINLGCYRDRAAGYDLPRLVREAGETPGLQRLRLSSIEINHVNDELIAALRETPTVSRHLHVPLQSGDDGVLRDMGRRYSVATYLRRLEPLRGEFNLTSDVIVGFPTEDERALRADVAHCRRRRAHEGARVPVLAASRHRHGRRRSCPGRSEEGARRASPGGLARGVPRALALEARHGGRGARRSPGSRLWRRLLAVARAGDCARRRARPRPRRRRVRRGSARRVKDGCLFCTLYREGDHVAATDGFVAIRDINPQAPLHLLVIPERHIDTFRDIGEFPADEARRMLEFVAEIAAREGLKDYRVVVNVGPSAGQTVFHLHWHVMGGWV